MPAASSSILFDAVGKQEKPASSSILFDIVDKQEKPAGSSYFFDIVGNFVGQGLIRNKQIKQRDIAADRLVDIPIQILSSRFGVDMTSTLISELLVVPSGKVAIILGILFEATVATSVTVPPTISLGIASGETDIFAAEPMQNFDVVGETWSNWLVFSHARAAAAGEAANLSITGATASALVSDIYLIGFLG